MRTVLLRRGLGLLANLVAISLIVFLIMNVLPGNPAATVLGLDASNEAIANLRAELGLDQPLWQRYGDWVIGPLQGDFG